MSGFLEQVADYLHRVYGDELHRFCIVFPNVRAGLFFKKYLAQLSDKPVWAPAFRSIESLFEEISGLTQADDLTLIFDLFKTFKQHRQSDETFDHFYFWGEMLLADFDDIDKQLVNAKDLFSNVSDLKEIDLLFDYLTEEQKNAIMVFWQDFNDGDSGALKVEFAVIWQLLYPIYESFKKRLKEKSLGYEGMIQREAAHILSDGLPVACHPSPVAYEKYVFIGFNALTNCEKYFFESLQKQKRAIFFWDYDDYYFDNLWHEAGVFIRENVKRFPSEWKIDSNNLLNPNKNIEIIAVPSETGQAKLAGQLLEAVTSDERQVTRNPSLVTIVLPDEHLLLPALSSLPDAIDEINVTMGYPFSCSPAYNLFERLASLQQHIRMYSDAPRFNHNDVCMLLQQPCMQEIIPDEANIIIKYIIEHNRIYVAQTEISDNELLREIFIKCNNAREFSQYLLSIISKIKDARPYISNDLNSQFSILNSQFSIIHDVLAADDIEMDVNTFCRLLRKHFATLKIPFKGEPLKGIQIMGMLETRALDFDNVIILSMNEGVFPKGSQKQSFIPYNLRKGFGLTTSERNDAISAYHFYRLIQRAADVRLLYNSTSTDLNSGEMSRYLSQLIYEPVFKVKQQNISFRVNIDSPLPIVKERTDDVKQILDKYLSSGDDAKWLSPSALNSYLDCRLRFYFRYIDGLKEKEEVADEIDYSVFGNLLHKTMELVYNPYIGTTVTKSILTQLQKNRQGIKNNLYKAFAKEYFHVEHVDDDDITGRNIIIREVLMKYIIRILELDKNFAPFDLISLEKCLDVSIPIHDSDGRRVTSDEQPVTRHPSPVTRHLNMRGYIDRLDFSNNSLRIIDYKTGNAKRSFSNVAALFDRSKSGNHAVFQTIMYARMLNIAEPQEKHISSCLYVMKEIFKDDFEPRITQVTSDESPVTRHSSPVTNYFDIADEFENELNSLLSEMFLSNEPFTQTEDINKCKNCLYADICR